MKKNFFKSYSGFTSITVVIILIILTSTAIPQNQKNKNIPDGLTQEQISVSRDANGNPIVPSEDPEVDAFQTKSMTGLNPGDRFGAAVKTAGDVNGDGYDDFIIGAHSTAGTGSGKAYIFFGGPDANIIPDVILSGINISDAFGYSVSTAGDVNGDGYSDVIISAVGYSVNTGRVYIYFGGVNMDITPDVVLDAEDADDVFGYSVSSAGDVNGDGYSDVMAGALYYGNKRGRAYIYFGGSLMNNTADVTMTGEGDYYEFGVSVSNAGDMNGDGFSDVIVGAHQYDLYGTGKAYVFLGGVNMNNVPDAVMSGEAAGDQFGRFLSEAGDVNGDGYDDIIAGMNGFNNGRDFAYVYFGSSAIDNVADVTFSEPSELIFGFGVSTTGDLNGDGFSDVMCAAWIYSTVSKVYIYYGGSNMNNVSDTILYGEGTNDRFGLALSTAGDVNADGYSDLIIGAYEYNNYTGKAFLYISDVITITASAGATVPEEYFLSQNYPNPFNPVTNINFDLPVESKLTITIFDITGREVVTLLNEILPAGYHTVEFNAGSMASGIYFCRMIASGNGERFVMTKKMTVIK